MPVTTCAATRVGLESMNCPSKTTKIAAPSETSVLVRNPAMRWRHWRSKPMTPPSRTAMMRSNASFSNAGSNIGGIDTSPR
jgi:hypothetical protein